eukprot:270829-Pyramimonas_sp.AAC.1
MPSPGGLGMRNTEHKEEAENIADHRNAEGSSQSHNVQCGSPNEAQKRNPQRIPSQDGRGIKYEDRREDNERQSKQGLEGQTLNAEP